MNQWTQEMNNTYSDISNFQILLTPTLLKMKPDLFLGESTSHVGYQKFSMEIAEWCVQANRREKWKLQ